MGLHESLLPPDAKRIARIAHPASCLPPAARQCLDHADTGVATYHPRVRAQLQELGVEPEEKGSVTLHGKELLNGLPCRRQSGAAVAILQHHLRALVEHREVHRLFGWMTISEGLMDMLKSIGDFPFIYYPLSILIVRVRFLADPTSFH